MKSGNKEIGFGKQTIAQAMQTAAIGTVATPLP